MSRNTSFQLGSHHEAQIEARIRSGRYSTASEVLRAALRALEDREQEHQALVHAIDEGLATGVESGTGLDLDEPSPADLALASWWLEQLVQDAQEQLEEPAGALPTAAPPQDALTVRAGACSRASEWLRRRAGRRLLVLELRAAVLSPSGDEASSG